MCGHIVGLMHCINSTNDPQGSIFLSNIKNLFNFLSLEAFDENQKLCTQRITAHKGPANGFSTDQNIIMIKVILPRTYKK